nr:uncharacterized protein LOC124806105 [Hydra vulgaris]
MSAMELYQALKANNHSLIDQIKLSNTAKLNKRSQKNSDGGADGFMDVAASNSLARLYADKLINEETCSMVPVRTPQDGNCLFSAVSIALIGNNMLATTLRKLCEKSSYTRMQIFLLCILFFVWGI